MLRIEGLLAQSAISQMAYLDVIANNLANANTVGYKRDEVLFSDFSQVLTGVLTKEGLVAQQVSYGSKPEEVRTIVSQGPIRRTDNPLDLAISGKGFFVVQTPEGERFTRAGNFQVDKDGFLVTSEGNKVLGMNGPIKLEGKKIQVNYLGEVLVDGNMVDKLRIVDFPKPYRLRKEGANLFVAHEVGFEPKGYKVLQGFLEDSSVNPVSEMVKMITAHRVYEASANAMKVVDELLGRVINEVPRV